MIFIAAVDKGATTYLGGSGLGVGVGGVGTPNFFIALQFWTAFNVRDRFNSFALNVFLFSLKSRFFKISLSTIYTRLNDLKFETPKIFRRGVHRAPSPNPPPLFLRLRLRFPDKLNTFSVIICTATDQNVE